MTTLIEFLTARLDEDERAARAATSGTWHAAPDAPGLGTWMITAHDATPGGGEVVCEGDREGGGVIREQDAVHIVRHDPARVLREVAAKRKILAEHREEGRGDHRGCAGCGWAAGDEVRLNEVEECPTLRALASVYADHPDYRQGWAP